MKEIKIKLDEVLSKRPQKKTSSKENTDLKTGIGPFTDSIVNGFIKHLTSEDVKNKIVDRVIEPLIEVVNERMQPYIYLVSTLYMVIVILLIAIIVLLFHKKN